MAWGSTRSRAGHSTFALACSALVWASAVIVMGIMAYLISEGWRGSHAIYILVISVLTTLFIPVTFFLRTHFSYVVLFNIVLGHLWIVAVAFAASDWVHSWSNIVLAAVAFCFIAFFFQLFNILYDWHHGFYRGGTHGTHAV
ncbi:hypothetical protein VTJ49DRAFT_3003 [Mycothermus thermophilus]|uniref:MARVEL domain-containing protein n=1 Tax=Humicola insolens TaxID=85995 RepID=A0ABR3V8G9_HUMIN